MIIYHYRCYNRIYGSMKGGTYVRKKSECAHCG